MYVYKHKKIHVRKNNKNRIKISDFNSLYNLLSMYMDVI